MFLSNSNMVRSEDSIEDLRRSEPFFGLGVDGHKVVLNGFISGDFIIQSLLSIQFNVKK